ncbi:MAG: response regulator [Phototrophicaceae bacterium]
MAKVLLVDDDKTTVMLLKTLLELDGFEIIATGSGAEVSRMVAQHLPDVVLMDYHLSDMVGIDVLRELRAHPQFSQLPIVIASGMDVEDEVMAAGANKFLVKPFEPDQLPLIFNALIQR